MSPSLKSRVYQILESSDPNDIFSQFDDWFVSGLVILDVTTFILGTSDYIAAHFHLFVEEVQYFSVTSFTILYFLQLWSCTADPRYADPVWGRLRYAMTPLAIIDLIAILPFYLRWLFPYMLLFKNSNIFRVLRLLKLIRYSEALQSIVRVINSKRQQLIMTLFTVAILLIFASSVMFFAESQEQPEAFPSIPAAMWWGVVTLTTVGYGDIYPVTVIGKLFGAILAFIGIGLFALPAGIIAAGFSEEIQRKNRFPEELAAISTQWTPEEKEAIAFHLERSSELMQLCLETAKNKFSNTVESEETIRDLAIVLYRNATDRFHLH
jgi:voltage-gated potassium channel